MQRISWLDTMLSSTEKAWSWAGTALNVSHLPETKFYHSPGTPEVLTSIPVNAGRDVDNSTTVPLGPSQRDSPEDPLPSNEQQTSPAVTPATAGTAPLSSATTNLQMLLASSYPLLLLTMSTVFFIS